MAYRFRDIERPRFTLQSGTLYAVLFLLLLFLSLDQTRALNIELSPEKIEELRQQQEELQRDMLFRFVDSPEDQVEPEKNVALSDLNRVAKSMTNEELDPQNDDPFSRGNSYELLQRNEEQPTSDPETQAKPLDADQVPSEAAPSQPEEPQPVKNDEEEKDIPELDTEHNSEQIGKMPTWAGAPRPYRPPTQEELAQANEAAKQAMAKENIFRSKNKARQEKQYDNIQGRATPSIGFSVDTAGHDLGPYLKRFVQLVRGNWRIPNIARLEASGVSVIQFRLHQNGHITHAGVFTESGFEALDTSSLNAIVNTHPAPPLPEHIKEEWIPIKFSFFYNMRPRR